MHPSPFSQFCAINKSQEMGEVEELIFLVSSGLHLGRWQVERTAGPTELRVVRGRAGPLPGHQEWLQREHGKSSRQTGVGALAPQPCPPRPPAPGQCCLPPRKASEEQTEAQGWLVGHSVGFVLMRLPAFQSTPCLSLEESFHLFGEISLWQSGVYQLRGPWSCSQAMWSLACLFGQELPRLAGAEDTARLLDAFMHGSPGAISPGLGKGTGNGKSGPSS